MTFFSANNLSCYYNFISKNPQELEISYCSRKPFSINSAYQTLESLNNCKKIIYFQKNETIQQIANRIYQGYQDKYKKNVWFYKRWIDTLKEYFCLSTQRQKITKLYQEVIKRSIILECKSASSIDKKNSQKTVPSLDQSNQQMQNKVLKKDHQALSFSTPVENRGGFANGGSTCYINTILQCVRNSSLFCRYLLQSRTHMPRFKNESEEKFLLRQQIRDLLLNIFEISNKGETVAGTQIDGLRKLFMQYNPSITTGFGDRRSIWIALHHIFNIPGNKQSDEGEDESLAYFSPILTIVADSPLGSLQKKMNVITADEKDILHDVSPLLAIVINQKPGLVPDPEFYLDIKLLNKSQSLKYRLIALNIDIDKYHSVAYIKNLESSNDSWVCFNDSIKHSVSTINDSVKKNIGMCFYERIS